MEALVQLLNQIIECKFCLQETEMDFDHYCKLTDYLNDIYSEVAQLKNAACKDCEHCGLGRKREGNSIFCRLKNLEYKSSAKSCDYWVQKSSDF